MTRCDLDDLVALFPKQQREQRDVVVLAALHVRRGFDPQQTCDLGLTPAERSPDPALTPSQVSRLVRRDHQLTSRGRPELTRVTTRPLQVVRERPLDR
nr:hypothetical protein GCM10025730_21100 [Promicromonospora thailandica]